MFGQVGGANEVSATRFAKPPGWTSNNSSSVSKVSKLSGHTVGPNSLLKVMAGDVLNARTDYYYQSPVTNNNNNLVTDVLTTLVQAIGGSAVTTSSVKNGASGISTNLNGSTPFAGVTDPNRYTTDNIPRAYLNIVFFDERFNFVAENSTGVRVSQAGDGAAPLVLPANIKAPKNGYAYIYVSNENDDAVYFDNLQVSDNRGRIIEENHYYAFGLKIAGISSTKLSDPNEGNINNKNLYNDKELIDEADLNWYDLGYRNYDPQTGRFLQIDPLTDIFPDFSTYSFAGDEPVGNIDLDGLAPIPGLNGTFANLGNVVVKAAPKAAHAANAGLTFAKVGSIALKTANVAYNSLVSVARTFNTYVNPLTPIVELASGKSVESDFSEDKSRVLSGAEGAMMLIPGGKVAQTMATTVERTLFKAIEREGVKLLNPAIKITEKGLAHTLERHTVNDIAKWAKKSKFFNSSEVESLVQKGTQFPMTPQTNGNFSRVVDAGRNIGIDRATGKPTSIYSIITDKVGNLVTAFPGTP